MKLNAIQGMSTLTCFDDNYPLQSKSTQSFLQKFQASPKRTSIFNPNAAGIPYGEVRLQVVGSSHFRNPTENNPSSSSISQIKVKKRTSQGNLHINAETVSSLSTLASLSARNSSKNNSSNQFSYFKGSTTQRSLKEEKEEDSYQANQNTQQMEQEQDKQSSFVFPKKSSFSLIKQDVKSNQFQCLGALQKPRRSSEIPQFLEKQQQQHQQPLSYEPSPILSKLNQSKRKLKLISELQQINKQPQSYKLTNQCQQNYENQGSSCDSPLSLYQMNDDNHEGHKKINKSNSISHQMTNKQIKEQQGQKYYILQNNKQHNTFSQTTALNQSEFVNRIPQLREDNINKGSLEISKEKILQTNLKQQGESQVNLQDNLNNNLTLKSIRNRGLNININSNTIPNCSSSSNARHNSFQNLQQQPSIPQTPYSLHTAVNKRSFNFLLHKTNNIPANNDSCYSSSHDASYYQDPINESGFHNKSRTLSNVSGQNRSRRDSSPNFERTKEQRLYLEKLKRSQQNLQKLIIPQQYRSSSPVHRNKYLFESMASKLHSKYGDICQKIAFNIDYINQYYKNASKVFKVISKELSLRHKSLAQIFVQSVKKEQLHENVVSIENLVLKLERKYEMQEKSILIQLRQQYTSSLVYLDPMSLIKELEMFNGQLEKMCLAKMNYKVSEVVGNIQRTEDSIERTIDDCKYKQIEVPEFLINRKQNYMNQTADFFCERMAIREKQLGAFEFISEETRMMQAELEKQVCQLQHVNMENINPYKNIYY